MLDRLTFEFLKANNQIKCKDFAVLRQLKEDACSQKIGEEQLNVLTDKKLLAEGKIDKEDLDQDTLFFREAKEKLRSSFLPETVKFIDPADEEEKVHDIDAVKLRKLYMKRIFRPKKGTGILEPMRQLIADHFVKRQ